MATAAPAATGTVIAVTGPVVDIEFPTGRLPSIFNAVRIEREGSPLTARVTLAGGETVMTALLFQNTAGERTFSNTPSGPIRRYGSLVGS